MGGDELYALLGVPEGAGRDVRNVVGRTGVLAPIEDGFLQPRYVDGPGVLRLCFPHRFVLRLGEQYQTSHEGREHQEHQPERAGAAGMDRALGK